MLCKTLGGMNNITLARPTPFGTKFPDVEQTFQHTTHHLGNYKSAGWSFVIERPILGDNPKTHFALFTKSTCAFREKHLKLCFSYEKHLKSNTNGWFNTDEKHHENERPLAISMFKLFLKIKSNATHWNQEVCLLKLMLKFKLRTNYCYRFINRLQ